MVVSKSNYDMKILIGVNLIIFFMNTWCIIYFIIGTYLIQDGKSPMPIDKETNNSVIEIFSGDVIKFGQGMALIYHVNNMVFGNNLQNQKIIHIV